MMLALTVLCFAVGYTVSQPLLPKLPISPIYVAGALALAPLAMRVLPLPGVAFSLAIVLMIAVPHKMPHIWLLPPVLAGIGVLVERVRVKPARADLFFLGWLGWLVLRWQSHPELQISSREFLEIALGLLFYLFTRLCVTRARLRQASWALLGAGTVGAATVLLEWMLGRVIAFFNDPSQYQWAGSSTEIFRPGGVFGGSPAAAISLALILLATVHLGRSRARLVRVCQAVMLLAIVATWARAGWVGLVAGAAVASFLLPYRHKARAVYVVALLAVAAFIMSGAIQNSRAYQLGVVRPGSTSSRLSFLEQAWPLATDSYRHLIVGRGFRAFMHANVGTHDSATLQNFVLLNRGGPHNDYMRAILEEGMIGLVLLLGYVLTPVAMGWRCARRLLEGTSERLVVAGLTGSAVCLFVAGLFHDLSNNFQTTSVGAVALGLLVTAAQAESTWLDERPGHFSRHGTRRASSKWELGT